MARRDRRKGILANRTYAHTWHGFTRGHRGFLKGKKRGIITRSTSIGSPIKRDAVYLNKKCVITKILYRNNKEVENNSG
jgi:hypothetical protein